MSFQEVIEETGPFPQKYPLIWLEITMPPPPFIVYNFSGGGDILFENNG